MVDPRLGIANVTRWTQVITDNELFVSMLSAYLLHEYPGFPVFHKDTFRQAYLTVIGDSALHYLLMRLWQRLVCVLYPLGNH